MASPTIPSFCINMFFPGSSHGHAHCKNMRNAKWTHPTVEQFRTTGPTCADLDIREWIYLDPHLIKALNNLEQLSGTK